LHIKEKLQYNKEKVAYFLSYRFHSRKTLCHLLCAFYNGLIFIISRLPYVQAVIAEVLRHATVVAMTLPHFARTNIKNFMGFDIPKVSLLNDTQQRAKYLNQHVMHLK
jgi:hypothetical protein